MRCTIFDAINSNYLGSGEVKKFEDKLLVVEMSSSQKVDTELPLIGEVEDGSYRGVIKFCRATDGVYQFKVKEPGVYDRRRYLRVPVKQRARVVYNKKAIESIVVEMAFASCKLLMDNIRMQKNDKLSLKMHTNSGEVFVTGYVFDYCGEVGLGCNKSDMYIVNFDEESLKNEVGAIIYGFMLEAARGRV